MTSFDVSNRVSQFFEDQCTGIAWRDEHLEISDETLRQNTVPGAQGYLIQESLHQVEDVSVGDRVVAQVELQPGSITRVSGEVVGFVPRSRNEDTIEMLAVIKSHSPFLFRGASVRQICLPLDSLEKLVSADSKNNSEDSA